MWVMFTLKRSLLTMSSRDALHTYLQERQSVIANHKGHHDGNVKQANLIDKHAKTSGVQIARKNMDE